MAENRIILHIDMNAFFASVEQQSNPALQGKPVAVIGAAKRTIITTCSYEARAFGVRTGMNSWEARQKCPELIFVVGNNKKYSYTSKQIIGIMREYTPLVEVFSIDEAFLDVTGCLSLFGSPEGIAGMIKERIRERFGLTCSVGIAPNKLLAKLASDMQKPDGLTVIPPERVAQVMERLPIQQLCGIGAKTQQQLAAFGIRTCGELGRFPVEILKKKFGVTGERLHYMGLGVDDAPVVPEEEAEEVKSVGHSTTLDADLCQRSEILAVLLQLSEMVGRRARKYRVTGKTVTLTVRYPDFTTFSRQLSRSVPTNNSDEIYRDAVQILDQLELAQAVRLLGVRITNLTHQAEQLPLFESERKKALVASAMDHVNNRFGDFSVTFGTLLGKECGAKVISPAWRPEGVRNVDAD
ncbi:DNA polymerase IV [Geomonas nitrogeniifigens]|uniref:DNA polymerase IV n=1 Tax=Geomonas diazotrophica TaxID=2843197 RepID=A0ABX8JC30_9BACT|nr:DNA polymerase IV [Geomonas nitrogeniifigens]QWV95868.1 DNA polymerase IV [Geomonas nitrogeniifigens]QXE84954.1 DNA polymerase IV [Geomonas nitrogeniifigens]